MGNEIIIDSTKIVSFEKTQDNEKNSFIFLNEQRASNLSNSNNSSFYSFNHSIDRIYYISDLHLMHKLIGIKDGSVDEIKKELKKYVDSIVKDLDKELYFIDDKRDVLLIGGDVSSDYSIFELFISLLRKRLDLKRINPYILFTLGNHELWDFPDQSFEQIKEKYESLLNQYGMHLLQNSIAFIDSEQRLNTISDIEIMQLPEKEARERLRAAKLIVFGGLAFSGFNNDFNADNGIYKNIISREQEIDESILFQTLYKKVLSTVPDRKVIVFTHTPMNCWSETEDYHKGYVYVSGHTHRNLFFDDGETRVYADNQVGYGNNNIRLKWFDIDTEYDYFCDYEDGIYRISAEDYIRFYKGKNLGITFTRKVYVLYMLKKNGYYCFLHRSKNDSLTILNGGALKRLKHGFVHYYYDNMDSEIKRIKNPLDKYSALQEQISAVIRNIGGDGHIHGCIIDIDWENHIYVNPVDLKITAYWASDIINKKIYPSVPALLSANCPAIYLSYNRLLKTDSRNLLAPKGKITANLSLLPQTYINTDIYKASREIIKMQKLKSNILTTWYEGE